MSDEGRSLGRNSDMDTPLSVAASQTSKGKGLTVKCGKNSAKMKNQGGKLWKCIQFKGKWVTPSEFESMSQVAIYRPESGSKVSSSKGSQLVIG